MKKAIARELKAIRLRKDIKLGQAAEDNGVCYETMRQIEKGCRNISIEFLEQLLNYYDISVFIFFKNVCEYMHN